MKTLIQCIIILFFFLVMNAYIFIPIIGYNNSLMSENAPWYMNWFVFSHVGIGILIMVIPLYYIIKWIDENIE